MTPKLIAGVDPDTRYPSVALVERYSKRLVQVMYCQSPWEGPPPGLVDVHGVIEDQPAIFAGVRQRDILRLAQSAGAVATWFTTREWVAESRWKRGIRKDIYQAWLRSTLSAEETKLLNGLNKTQLKEVLDAVGIALWRVGRAP